MTLDKTPFYIALFLLILLHLSLGRHIVDDDYKPAYTVYRDRSKPKFKDLWTLSQLYGQENYDMNDKMALTTELGGYFITTACSTSNLVNPSEVIYEK
jgi:hypothetical protein